MDAMIPHHFTRPTDGFSKNCGNLAAAVGLHLAHYNFCRTHKTLRTPPAVAHGIENHVWTVEELLTKLVVERQRPAQPQPVLTESS
jgi:hypothetical protein